MRACTRTLPASTSREGQDRQKKDLDERARTVSENDGVIAFLPITIADKLVQASRVRANTHWGAGIVRYINAGPDARFSFVGGLRYTSRSPSRTASQSPVRFPFHTRLLCLLHCVQGMKLRRTGFGALSAPGFVLAAHGMRAVPGDAARATPAGSGIPPGELLPSVATSIGRCSSASRQDPANFEDPTAVFSAADKRDTFRCKLSPRYLSRPELDSPISQTNQALCSSRRFERT
jgi:hypothetical protein